MYKLFAIVYYSIIYCLIQITLSSAERANFQAGDTIGITWTNYGAITYNDVVGYNYCEDNVGQPAVGKSISLVAGRYGSRVYSIESLYIQNGPGELAVDLNNR